MGWRDGPDVAPSITIPARKNRSETGAKKVTLAAKGPGLSFSGSPMPMAWPEIRFEKRQASAHPSAVELFSCGDTVPAGKSMSLKFVRMVSTKSRTCETPFAAKRYVHDFKPRERYRTSSDMT